MKPEELATQFAEATLSFDQIIGQPTDSDIVRIYEALAQILLPIPYDEAHADHNLIGLVYSEAEYMAEYIDAFVTPSKPGIYDKDIPEDATEGVRARMEAIHKAVRRDYGLYEAAERGARQFIIDVVEETYIRDLKHNRLFYTQVKPIDFLDHLQATCGGLHAIDLLALQGSMQTAHKECDGIPEYIHTLEDAQAKAARANVPITDTMLMIIANSAMLQTKKYPVPMTNGRTCLWSITPGTSERPYIGQQRRRQPSRRRRREARTFSDQPMQQLCLTNNRRT